jgi:hypothetical protein
LQSESTLKELAAVQTAAQDKMPFEQRAGVAENLENVILCHAAQSVGRRNASDKIQVQRVTERAIQRAHLLLILFLILIPVARD